ncbi:hypothetical protein [Arthrobacter sp.]|uniref:hypothetical protein n=1 Tax=Arthrobacter sp. TaxID=1667 RepID=UPI003A92ED11
MRPVLAAVSSVLLLSARAHPAGATTPATEAPDKAQEPILVQGSTDEYVDTDFPWKAYIDSDNEVHVLYGPGAPSAAVDGHVLDGRDGSDEFYRKLAALPETQAKTADPQGVSAMAAPKWVCENYQPSPRAQAASSRPTWA